MDILIELFNLTYGPILVIAVSILIYYALKRIINKLLSLKIGRFDVSARRQKTLEGLFHNIAKSVIIIIVILTILSIYGIDTNTVLASLGVISIVLGLAFQDILKDFLSGIFILSEGSYTIGDTVEINNFKGKIEDIGLRTTKIKAYTGEIKILANRNISEVTNYSLSNSLAVIDIKFDIKKSTKEIDALLAKLIEKIDNHDYKKVIGAANLLGIQELNDTFVIYRLTVPTKANESKNIEYEVLKELKLLLEKKTPPKKRGSK